MHRDLQDPLTSVPYTSPLPVRQLNLARNAAPASHRAVFPRHADCADTLRKSADLALLRGQFDIVRTTLYRPDLFRDP